MIFPGICLTVRFYCVEISPAFVYNPKNSDGGNTIWNIFDLNLNRPDGRISFAEAD
jgi:hypothetical protein